MNLRLGRFGLQESACAVGLGALISGVFTIDVNKTFAQGNLCYAATAAGILLCLLLHESRLLFRTQCFKSLLGSFSLHLLLLSLLLFLQLFHLSLKPSDTNGIVRPFRNLFLQFLCCFCICQF